MKLELLGAAEVADRLGISRSALVHRRRSVEPAVPFPDPVAELRCGPIWKLEDIHEYLAEWRACYPDGAAPPPAI